MLNDGTTRVGIVGCGNILPKYVRGMARFPDLDVVACADADPGRAVRAAGEFGLTAATVEELTARDDIGIIVNITPPNAHAAVSLAALEAGKDVYVEKPLASTAALGADVLAAADRYGRMLGAAPDTFLGSAAQTARAALDRGDIGEPVGATAFVTHSRAELWHPDPTFLFRPGGGPVLDMGPYYLTALVACLGPVSTVYGASRIGAPVRTVTAPERRVDTVEVTAPTHAAATLTFANGVLGTVLMSFDIWHRTLPHIEVYGTEGVLSLADPNGYDGPVAVRRHRDADPVTLPPVVPPLAAPGGPDQLLRGVGVADLAAARHGGPHRATARLARHVLEVLEAVQDSGGRAVPIASTCTRPAPLDHSHGARPLTEEMAR
ncbi:Gfo/Idh/MocA family protein [Spirillospora sp. NPDC127200]